MRIEAAREQVEQQIFIQPTGGCAVRSAHLIDADLEPWPQIDLGRAALDQSAQRLSRLRARCCGVDTNMSAESQSRALIGNTAEHLLAARGGGRMQYLQRRIVHL